jgi:hypothetical protein
VLIVANWRAVAIGPISVAGSSGSPIRSDRARSTTADTTCSATEVWTSSREGAVHISPELKKMPQAAVAAAVSREGASGKTMLGDLPPSSSQTRLRLESAE